MTSDYYKILEVSKDATQEEIQSSYRKLARKYHPDMNQSDPKGSREKFQKIQEAYDIVGNPEKRRIYDQFGVSPDQMGAGGGQGPFQWSFGASNPSRSAGVGGLDDLINMFTRGMNADEGSGVRQQRRAKIGDDIEGDLSIPFSVSINGGKVDKKVRNPNSAKEETISITIQAGTENGKKIRIQGFGKSGQNGGKAGNLILTVKVEEHVCFKRDGQDLYVTVPITLKEAVFGGNADIPTPKGTISIKIPKGSSSGKKLRVKGYGVPANSEKTKSSRIGDLYAVFSVILPETWNTEDENRIKELNSEIQSPRENLKF
ncbi:MAG: DnaJ domain-containing protein [Planctomycetaceae bacterium]|jgi:DnaJ-class molecular chaperone|nr:DnaJ domain-containing protein [Planctomycetaceae bacterium]